jgi:hypothetical protein
MSGDLGQAPPGALFRRRATIVFSALAALLGATSVVITVSQGGGPLQARLLVGVLLMLLGAMRLWLTLQTPPPRNGSEQQGGDK